MTARMERVLVIPVIAALVALINVVLFTLFPALHQLFGDPGNEQTSHRNREQVVVEFKKPEEKKPEKIEQRIRQISNVSRSATPDPLLFRFTPDLAVEGAGGVAMESQDLEAVIFEEGQTDEGVVPLYQPPVPYPERARDLAIEGTLHAILIIDRDGRVSSVEIVKAPHQSIAAVARKAFATWRFKPAKNKGIPVRMRVSQVIEFKLD